MSTFLQAINRCEDVIGRPISLDTQGRHGLEHLSIGASKPDSQLRWGPFKRAVGKLRPKTRFGVEIPNVVEYKQAFEHVMDLCKFPLTGRRRETACIGKLADYACNTATQFISPAVHHFFVYGEATISFSIMLSLLLKKKILGPGHIGRIVDELGNTKTETEQEKRDLFKIAGGALKPINEFPLESVNIGSETLVSLERILREGGRAGLNILSRKERERPTVHAFLAIVDAEAILQFLRSNSVEIHSETFRQLSEGISAVFSAESKSLEFDIDYLSRKLQLPNSHGVNTFVRAVAGYAKENPVTIPRESFGRLGEWYTFMLQNKFALVTATMREAKKLGVSLEEGKLSCSINTSLRDQQAMNSYEGEAVIEMAAHCLEAGISVNLDQLGKQISKAVVDGEFALSPNSFEVFLKHGAISGEAAARAIEESSRNHQEITRILVRRHPDLAEGMLYNKKNGLDLFFIEAVMNSGGNIIDRERFARFCDQTVSSQLRRWA